MSRCIANGWQPYLDSVVGQILVSQTLCQYAVSIRTLSRKRYGQIVNSAGQLDAGTALVGVLDEDDSWMAVVLTDRCREKH